MDSNYMNSMDEDHRVISCKYQTADILTAGPEVP